MNRPPESECKDLASVYGTEAEGRIGEQVLNCLQLALSYAEDDYARGEEVNFKLSPRLKSAIENLSAKSETSTTAFTNIVTAISIKAARPEIDVRYHQVQIQNQTNRPAGFNFRGVSEKNIYPWLSKNEFNGAKSGWQTRTFERPKPYFLSYDENIGTIKTSFLEIYDELESGDCDPFEALRFLIYKQIQMRAKKGIIIAEPKTRDIATIVRMLTEHFSQTYKNKGASRLPVLAFHAIYTVLVREMQRFHGMSIRPLESHSAADAQTGAIGDIEIARSDGSIFEALEIKHNIPIDSTIIEHVKRKVMDKSVDRYYVLTTHISSDKPGLEEELTSIQARFGCQVIVNGVYRSLYYYLRLLSDPSSFAPEYAALLKNERAISFEHREAWNRIAMG